MKGRKRIVREGGREGGAGKGAGDNRSVSGQVTRETGDRWLVAAAGKEKSRDLSSGDGDDVGAATAKANRRNDQQLPLSPSLTPLPLAKLECSCGQPRRRRMRIDRANERTELGGILVGVVAVALSAITRSS
jgi:hypothetical protein